VTTQELERLVTALKANLASKGATLREAQDSLSETEGKLHEEYDKNDELSRENMALAEQVERLQEELRQSEAVRCVRLLFLVSCFGSCDRV
jgi:methylphosphotriester-DNA--protein-cysteine methyltransferase